MLRLRRVLNILIFVWAATPAAGADELVARGAPALLTPQQSLKAFTAAEGFEINLFASEQDFPIGNLVAMKWDRRGRLWVANIPSFPQVRPDEEYPDSIVILEDTDGDGRADKHTVFADKLYLPLGFVISDQGRGAYVSAQPNLIHLLDTDGNDVADTRHVVLHGFGTEDSHHAISAFQWSPDGSIYMADGTFLFTNVETPWGPRRVHDSGVYRFKPSIGRLDVFGNYGWTNPWGIAFDRWGHPVLMDASPGRNYYLPHLMQNFAYEQIPATETSVFAHHTIPELSFFQKGRPNCGSVFVSSRNFPDDVQGTYLNGQMVGFHGLRWAWVEEHGSGLRTTQVRDLLSSTDESFRPVDLNFGPDGALYVADFYNPVVGHMTYEFRDPRRDKTHGRVWRIRYKGRPLEEHPKFVGEPVDRVLELLTHPTEPVRWQALRELQERSPHQVLPAVEKWVASLNSSHPDHELHLLEALWVYQGHDELNKGLLERLLSAEEGNIRASAARALRFEMYRYGDAMPWLARLATDRHMRVRLEAVNALSFVESAEAVHLILEASKLPMDAGLYHAMKRALNYLTRVTGASLAGTMFEVRDLPSPQLLERLRTGFSDTVGYEVLRRNDVPHAVHEEVFDYFEKSWRVDRVTTLLRIAAALTDQGVTDVSGIAHRLGSISPEQAAAGRAALTEVLAREGGDGFTEMRKAAYSGLLLDPHTNVPELLSAARRRGDLPLLAAGANMISHAPTQQRLMPLFLADIKENGAPAQAVRDLLAGPLRTSGDFASVFALLSGLAESGTAAHRRGAIAAMQSLPLDRWPTGYDAYAGRLKISPRTLALGSQVYLRDGMCGTCHRPDGRGVPGAFPPLAASSWVEGDPERLIKVSQAGLIGPLEVDGITYNSAMPPVGALLTDEEMAAVLTYIRTSWDNIGSEITPEQIKQVRAKMGGRLTPWTASEIQNDQPAK